MSAILNFIKTKKKITAIVVLVVLGAVYYGYKKVTETSAETRYVFAVVQKGAIISSVSGTGQITVSNQVDIKSKVSGDVVAVQVAEGQEVKAGTALVVLDAKDARKTVRDAEANLASARLALDKLQQPADALSLIQSENALIQAKDTKQNVEDSLKKAYDDGFNTVANAFVDIPAIVTGVHDILYGNNFGTVQNNADYYVNAATVYNDKIGMFRDGAVSQYQTAKVSYDKSFAEYKVATRLSGTDTINALISHTYDTAQSVAEAVKTSVNFIQLYEDSLSGRNIKPQSLADTQLASLNVYTGKLNTHLANLLGTKNTITNSKNAISAADRSIAEKTESLAKLKSGADKLDIQSQQLAVKQKQNSLVDAQEKLADYTVRAPFGGIAAKINIKRGDSMSANSVAATFITKQKTAQISLNEVDAAKINVGQKATITFDAVPGLEITGEVAEIDTLGTFSQGVVTYNIKIVFDTQDERVKPAMSANAAIITNIRQDVLFVPNSAVRARDDTSYIEMFDKTFTADELAAAMKNTGIAMPLQPRQKIVTVGISNDVSTEVLSGLKDGDVVVARVIAASSQKTSAQQAPSLFGSPGVRTGGSGMGGAGAFRNNR